MNMLERRTTTMTMMALGLVAAGCGDDIKPCSPEMGGICTIAGSGENGYSGEEGLALEANFSLPVDVLKGSDNQLFISDWNNHRIRRLNMKDGYVHFVIGNGELGGNIDDPATSQLNHPTNLMWDATGSFIYIAAWHNSKILKLDPLSGEIIDSYGDGRRAYFGDGTPATTASLDLPTGIALSPAGNITVLDQANQVIRSVDLQTGMISRVGGQCIIDQPAPAGPGACAEGVAPTKCPGASGKYTCGDPAMTCSKPCWPGYTGDDIPATTMRMSQVFGQAADPGGRIVYDPAGNLYFADVQNALIRMIDTSGIVHRVAGIAPVGGVANPGYSGDGGPATSAQINHPVDLARGNDGTLYFTDVYNHCVRAIDSTGTIRTVAGVCGTKGFDGDGGAATDALLNRPYGIEWAAPNTLYIADTGNSVIREVHLP
jgi:hypothetical protein